MYLNMEKMMFWRVEKTACLAGVFVCIFLVKVRLLFYFCKCFSCKNSSFVFFLVSLVFILCPCLFFPFFYLFAYYSFPIFVRSSLLDHLRG